MKAVQKFTQKWFSFPAILLGAVLLRAFVPAGYMPAAPGNGLLFELCHDGLPVSFMSALEGHAHHGDHSAHDDHGAVGDCSFGHILTGAYIDAPDVPELPVVPADTVSPVILADARVAQRIYASAPRGPPSRKR
jgi:hypothetical protein